MMQAASLKITRTPRRFANSLRRLTPHRLALCVALQTCCSVAYAHAFLEQARPAVGSSVHGSPAEIQLKFSAPLEPAFSNVKVLDQSGRQVDSKDKQLDRGDPAQIKVTVPTLAKGTYRVVWHALSVDSHVTDGDFTFEVVP
jgi:methionine-rich copper-binding protein CopC